MKKMVEEYYCDLCGRKLNEGHDAQTKMLYYKPIGHITDDSIITRSACSRELKHLCTACGAIYKQYQRCMIHLGTNVYYLCQSNFFQEHPDLVTEFQKEIDEVLEALGARQ